MGSVFAIIFQDVETVFFCRHISKRLAARVNCPDTLQEGREKSKEFLNILPYWIYPKNCNCMKLLEEMLITRVIFHWLQCGWVWNKGGIGSIGGLLPHLFSTHFFTPNFFCFLFCWNKGGIGWSQLLPQLPTDRKVLSPVHLLLLSSHKNTKNKWEFLKSWKKCLMAHLMKFGLRPPAKPSLWSWKKQVCQMSFQAFKKVIEMVLQASCSLD